MLVSLWSLGISSRLGSKYPNTTKRAFALCVALAVFGWLFSPSPTLSRGFHVKIHRQRKIWSSGIWFLSTLDTVPVCTQLWTSDILAFSNSALSAVVSSVSFTSERCFLALVASMVHASHWFSGMALLSESGMSNSQRQAVAGSSVLVVRHQSTSTQVSISVLSRLLWFPDASGMAEPWREMSGSWSGWGVVTIELGDRLIGSLGESWLLKLSLSGSCGLCKFWLLLGSMGISTWSVGWLIIRWLRLSIWRPISVRFSGHESGHSGISDSRASLTCSGALRKSFAHCVVHTVCWPSWMITLCGPIHPALFGGSPLHIMTHWPFTYVPRWGQALRRMARRRLSLLSASWKAFRALSRMASIFLKSPTSSWLSSWVAISWEGMDSSLMTDPGILECFPNTIISGAYPWRMLKLFLAWVLWLSASCKVG